LAGAAHSLTRKFRRRMRKGGLRTESAERSAQKAQVSGAGARALVAKARERAPPPPPALASVKRIVVSGLALTIP